MTYDVAILGAGPGGYVAAIRGGQLGAKVCLIEEEDLGGTCLNRGCIPSKAFHQSAIRMEHAKRGEEFGVQAKVKGFNLGACVARTERVVGDLVGGVQKLLNGYGVEIIQGRGILTSPDVIQVTGADGAKRTIAARAVILATGSRPADLPGLPIDGRRIVNSDQIWGLTDLPTRAVVVGGGAIGCEIAYYYAAFGVQVTVLEVLDRILATEEKDASRTVQKSLEGRSVEVRTGVRVAGADVKGAEIEVKLEGGASITCDRVIVAVGRTPNSKGIGLEKAGVEVDGKGRVVVNDEMETTVPGVYAVGDLVGQFMLAHVATSEALVAMHNALGKKYWMDYSVVPYAVFTCPEVASVGAKEAELKSKKVDYKVGRFSFGASGKALCIGEPEGFIKILSDTDSGRILGATVVGAQASEIIGELTVAMRMEASPGDIVTTIHVHPTLSEVVLEASEDTMGLSIHKMGRRSAREE